VHEHLSWSSPVWNYLHLWWPSLPAQGHPVKQLSCQLSGHWRHPVLVHRAGPPSEDKKRKPLCHIQVYHTGKQCSNNLRSPYGSVWESLSRSKCITAAVEPLMKDHSCETFSFQSYLHKNEVRGREIYGCVHVLIVVFLIYVKSDLHIYFSIGD